MNKNFIKKIIDSIIYIIFFWYPILVLTNCSWNEWNWITWCNLKFLENSISNFFFDILILSSFTLFIPILIYIFLVILFQKYFSYFISKIFFWEFKKEDIFKTLKNIFRKIIYIFFWIIIILSLYALFSFLI